MSSCSRDRSRSPPRLQEMSGNSGNAHFAVASAPAPAHAARFSWALPRSRPPEELQLLVGSAVTASLLAVSSRDAACRTGDHAVLAYNHQFSAAQNVIRFLAKPGLTRLMRMSWTSCLDDWKSKLQLTSTWTLESNLGFESSALLCSGVSLCKGSVTDEHCATASRLINAELRAMTNIASTQGVAPPAGASASAPAHAACFSQPAPALHLLLANAVAAILVAHSSREAADLWKAQTELADEQEIFMVHAVVRNLARPGLTRLMRMSWTSCLDDWKSKLQPTSAWTFDSNLRFESSAFLCSCVSLCKGPVTDQHRENAFRLINHERKRMAKIAVK